LTDYLFGRSVTKNSKKTLCPDTGSFISGVIFIL
jgi:hypothetical protein